MKANEICKKINEKLQEINAQSKMTLRNRTGEDKVHLSHKRVFVVSEHVAGFFWLDNRQEITGITLQAIPEPGALAEMLLYIALLIDHFSETSLSERNYIMQQLGMNDKTWIQGKQLEREGFRYKIYQNGVSAFFEIMPVKE